MSVAKEMAAEYPVASDLMTVLDAGGFPKDQDWDAGTTTWTLDDGSTLTVCGNDVTIDESDVERAVTPIEITSVSQAEIDSDGYANYEVTFKIGEHERTVEGYCLCGWLKPGASGDLDGSGLALWGDAQPGGWSVCDGDSQGGRLRVNGCGSGCGSNIQISNGVGGSAINIEPWMVPEWYESVMSAHSLEKDDDLTAFDIAAEIAEAVRNGIIERLESLCRDYKVDCPEPDASEVYEYLDDLDGLSGIAVKVGEYKGCGAVVAWIDDDGYGFDWWPNPQSLSDRLLASVRKEVEQYLAREIERISEN